MNKELKNTLQSAFDPPKPQNKDAFLSKMNYPKTNRKDFFESQTGYIRKRVWAYSLLLLAGALFSTLCMEANDMQSIRLIWIFAAALPFLVLITVTELSRSAFFNMAELEMSCRYSLSDVVITRATILGAVNLLIFIALLAVTSGKTEFGPLRSGLYLLVPYMLTCVGSLLVLNRLRGKDGILGCSAVACFTSMANGFLGFTKELIYSERFVLVWAIIFAVCVWILITQLQQFIKRAEDNSWNSLLTD